MQTPRAQRTSTDAQTWEFSHHKFLRGRPDLLDEIKRKALEPDPSVKHRVELPGEVQSQLNQMRDENRRVAAQLNAERAKVDRLAALTKSLYEVVDKNFPGWRAYLSFLSSISFAPFPSRWRHATASPRHPHLLPLASRGHFSKAARNMPCS